MKHYFLFILTTLSALLVSCNGIDQPEKGKDTDEPQIEDSLVYLAFMEDPGDFANPERGYYYPFAFHKAGDPVSAAN